MLSLYGSTLFYVHRFPLLLLEWQCNGTVMIAADGALFDRKNKETNSSNSL